MGVGVGIVASGTLTPLLLNIGLQETWLELGALSLVLTALAWTGWPKSSAAPASSRRAHSRAAVISTESPLRLIRVERGWLGSAHDLPC